MTRGRKLWLGVLSFAPAVLLVAGVVALVSESGDGSLALFYIALALSGILDMVVAAFVIPHVHDNTRIGKDWKIAWIAGLGIPYITIAPVYWLMHVLPDQPRPEGEAKAAPGGAWYADPWGEAPLRWWDGERWTDWVTGPPG